MNRTRFRERYLIDLNVRWIEQGIALLDRMSDADYVRPVPALAGQRVGPQMRHIIDFFESLLSGLHYNRIDYDARRRDPVLEANRAAAIEKLRELKMRMEDSDLPGDRVVWVRVEDAPDGAHIMSSVARELQALSSHTVHHFALVGMIARMLGVEVEDSFGVAPSTLSYREALPSIQHARLISPCVQ